MKLSTLCATLLVLITATSSLAEIITLTPSDINGGETSTSMFSNGELSLIPLQGTTPATFNANAARLGIDDFGTNANAFNDSDTDPNNGNEERLEYIFNSTSGLNSISYDFSRADGTTPDDGVIISGFLSDPGVTFSVSDPDLTATYDGAGSVRLNIPGSLFGGTDVVVGFNPNSSAGQTLVMSVTDTDQAGAQFAITEISYNNMVPEPQSLLLIGLGSLLICGYRRH